MRKSMRAVDSGAAKGLLPTYRSPRPLAKARLPRLLPPRRRAATAHPEDRFRNVAQTTTGLAPRRRPERRQSWDMRSPSSTRQWFSGLTTTWSERCSASRWSPSSASDVYVNPSTGLPGTRYDGGPEEGTRGGITSQAPPGTRYDGGPEEGTRA